MWLNLYGREAVRHKLKNGLKTPKKHFLTVFELMSGIPEFRPFGQKGKFSAFGLRFRPPKLKAEYGRNSRKALDFLLFVHENIANVNYQW